MAFWKRGDKKELAKLAKISTSNLSEILHRDRGVSRDRAWALEAASRKVQGESYVPWVDWLHNSSTTHPAFYGTPKNGS